MSSEFQIDILKRLSEHGFSLREEVDYNVHQVRYMVTNPIFTYSFVIDIGDIVWGGVEQYQSMVMVGVKRAIEEYKKWEGSTVNDQTEKGV